MRAYLRSMILHAVADYWRSMQKAEDLMRELEILLEENDTGQGAVHEEAFPEEEMDDIAMIYKELSEEERILREGMESEAETEKTKFVELHYQIYIDDSFPVHDAYWQIYNEFIWLEDYLYLIPALAVFGILVTVCAFLFLMCSAGHHRGKAEITGGVLSNFHFDVVTLLFGAVAMFLLVVSKEIWSGDVVSTVVLIAIGAVETVWCTIYCMELSVQLKMGTMFSMWLIG